MRHNDIDSIYTPSLERDAHRICITEVVKLLWMNGTTGTCKSDLRVYVIDHYFFALSKRLSPTSSILIPP